MVFTLACTKMRRVSHYLCKPNNILEKTIVCPNSRWKFPWLRKWGIHLFSSTYKWIGCRFVWPRDLCYVRYWRRNDDGSYGKLFGCLHLIWSSNLSQALEISFLLFVQLCYFVLECMRNVIHNQVMCGPISRVSSICAFSLCLEIWDQNLDI